MSSTTNPSHSSRNVARFKNKRKQREDKTSSISLGDSVSRVIRSTRGTILVKGIVLGQGDSPSKKKNARGTVVAWNDDGAGAPVVLRYKGSPGGTRDDENSFRLFGDGDGVEGSQVVDDSVVRELIFYNNDKDTATHTFSTSPSTVPGMPFVTVALRRAKKTKKTSKSKNSTADSIIGYIHNNVDELVEIVKHLMLDRAINVDKAVKLKFAGEDAFDADVIGWNGSKIGTTDDVKIWNQKYQSGPKLMFRRISDGKEYEVAADMLASTVVGWDKLFNAKRGVKSPTGRIIGSRQHAEHITAATTEGIVQLTAAHALGHLNKDHIPIDTGASAAALAFGSSKRLLRRMKSIKGNLSKQLPRRLNRLYTSKSGRTRFIQILANEHEKFIKHMESNYSNILNSTTFVSHTQHTEMHQANMAFMNKNCPLTGLFLHVYAHCKGETRNKIRTREEKERSGMFHLSAMCRSGSSLALPSFATLVSHAFISVGTSMNFLDSSNLLGMGESQSETYKSMTTAVNDMVFKSMAAKPGTIMWDNVDQWGNVKFASRADGKVSGLHHWTAYQMWCARHDYGHLNPVPKLMTRALLIQSYQSEQQDPDPTNKSCFTKVPAGDQTHYLKPPSVRKENETLVQQTVAERVEVAFLQQMIEIGLSFIQEIGKEPQGRLQTLLKLNQTVVDTIVQSSKKKIYFPKSSCDAAPDPPTEPIGDRLQNVGVVGLNEMKMKDVLTLLNTVIRDAVGTPTTKDELVKELLAEGIDGNTTPQIHWASMDMGSVMALRNAYLKALRLMMSDDPIERDVALQTVQTIDRLLVVCDFLHTYKINGNEAVWKCFFATFLSPLVQNEYSSLKPSKVTSNAQASMDYLQQSAISLGYAMWSSILSNTAIEKLIRPIDENAMEEETKTTSRKRTHYIDPNVLLEEIKKDQQKGGEARKHWMTDILPLILPLVEVDTAAVRHGESGLLFGMMQYMIPAFNKAGKYQYTNGLDRQRKRIDRASEVMQGSAEHAGMLELEAGEVLVNNGALVGRGVMVEGLVGNAKVCRAQTTEAKDRHVKMLQRGKNARKIIGLRHDTEARGVRTHSKRVKRQKQIHEMLALLDLSGGLDVNGGASIAQCMTTMYDEIDRKRSDPSAKPSHEVELGINSSWGIVSAASGAAVSETFGKIGMSQSQDESKEEKKKIILCVREESNKRVVNLMSGFDWKSFIERQHKTAMEACTLREHALANMRYHRDKSIADKNKSEPPEKPESLTAFVESEYAIEQTRMEDNLKVMIEKFKAMEKEIADAKNVIEESRVA